MEYKSRFIHLFIEGSFNPFMPTAGVGIKTRTSVVCNPISVSILLCPQRALEYCPYQNWVNHHFLFQSFYAHSGRWNFTSDSPASVEFLFQSFYAHSGRWNSTCHDWTIPIVLVSILLCPQRALEWWIFSPIISSVISFNPFMPTAGVGIVTNIDKIQQPYSFNPFMPTAGVGMYTVFRKHKTDSRFQSFYAHSGRWNVLWNIVIKRWHDVSILLCPQRALECSFFNGGVMPHLCFNPFMPTAGVGMLR